MHRLLDDPTGNTEFMTPFRNSIQNLILGGEPSMGIGTPKVITLSFWRIHARGVQMLFISVILRLA